MLYKDLEKDSIIKDWLNSISNKEGTRRLYIFAMQYYTEFLKMTPEEILTEAEQDVMDRVLPRLSKMRRHLLDYKEHLQNQDIAPLTVKSRMTGVYGFYKKHDIPLPSMPRNECKARPLKQHRDIPTKEDIQTVLKHCDELERVLVLLGVSGGLGAQEICNLTVGDFRKGYDHETGITTLKLRREKEEYDFVTYLSPETSNAVLDYLKTRDKKPKVITKRRLEQIEKQKIYSDSDYLLICRRISPKFLKNKDDKLRQLSEEAIIDIYRALAESAQKTTPLGTWSIIRSHNMRKFFNSALLNAGADSFIVNFLMGHTLDDTQSAYFRAAADGELKEQYKKYIPYLTIQKEADISESPEYLRIKNENQILQAETARHVVERSELQEVNAKLEKANKQIAEMKEDYQSLQADKELANTVNQHYIDEAIRKGMAELLLTQSQERLKKNIKGELVDISSIKEDVSD